MPFGATLGVGRGFSVQSMYDGDRTHLLMNYAATRVTASLLWIWLERPGVAVSLGF